MNKNISWTGTHPSLAILAEAVQERDEWQARAEAAEKRVEELERVLGNTVMVTVDGVIYRALPEPWGYTGVGG